MVARGDDGLQIRLVAGLRIVLHERLGFEAVEFAAYDSVASFRLMATTIGASGFRIFPTIGRTGLRMGRRLGRSGFSELCSGNWSRRTTLSSDLFTWMRPLYLI